MIFKYKGITLKGANESGRIEASSEIEAINKLKELGIFAEKVKEIKSEDSLDKLREFFFLRYNKIDANYLSALSKELSVYLKSGISLIQAISLIKEQQDTAKNRRFLEQAHKMLNEGSSFSASLKKQAVYGIPEFFIKTVEASEAGGNLDKVLEQLSELLKKSDKIAKDIQNALIYPIFIFMMSFFVVIFLINYVIPKISTIFEQLNQELPMSTKIVIGAGNFMQNYGIYAMLGFVIIMTGFAIAIKYNEGLQKKFDHMILKIPMIGKMIFVSEIARFSVISANLLSAGIPLVQSVLLSSQTLKNRIITDEIHKANQKVVEGVSLSKALSECEKLEIPKSFIHSISVGENSGNLPEMMNNISELYMFDIKNRQDKFMALLEPIIILSMGIIVGFIVVSMLLPIFNLNFQ